MTKTILALCTIILSACSQDFDYFHEHSDSLPHEADATFWIKPGVGLDGDKIREATHMLSQFGVMLNEVTDEREAQITVSEELPGNETCDDDIENISIVSAYKVGCGKIVVCQRSLRGKNNDRELYAHELMHAVGVDHVPYKCDDTSKTDPEFGPACGQGIMNPAHERDLTDFTMVDAAAFRQLRTLDNSIFDENCMKQFEKKQNAE